ncbi:hypothetical protein N234_08820 [Ralstonia pickettii DTP0602]|nr:hypothetical protein N234_08820 [Ralstonia pickettii DTP0602]
MHTISGLQGILWNKALLVGGISAPQFGGGEVLRPIRSIVSGPVTELPAGKAEQIVEEAIRQYLETCLGAIGGTIQV